MSSDLDSLPCDLTRQRVRTILIFPFVPFDVGGFLQVNNCSSLRRNRCHLLVSSVSSSLLSVAVCGLRTGVDCNVLYHWHRSLLQRRVGLSLTYRKSERYQTAVSIRCALLAVPPGSDAVCVTQSAAADFQTDQKGLALLREGLNVRGAWSSQADSVALQSQVSVCLRHVN